MKKFFASMILSTSVSAFVQMAYAETPLRLEHETSDHVFISVETGSQNLVYEACNDGDIDSSFHWSGARFGVDAKGPLPPGYCVKKSLFPVPYDEVTEERSTVRSHNWSDSAVPTLVHCPVDVDAGGCELNILRKFEKSVLELWVFSSDPDGKPYPVADSEFRFEEVDEELRVSVTESSLDDARASAIIFFGGEFDPKSARVESGEVRFTTYNDILEEFGHDERTETFGPIMVLSPGASFSIAIGDVAGGAFFPSVATETAIVYSSFQLRAPE